MTQKLPESPNDTRPLDPFAALASKRPAPPKVSPVKSEGIRYEQADDHDIDSSEQHSGYLAAFKGASKKPLWLVKVYDLDFDPRLERDVQEVYFSKLEISPERREIIVENERGERFAVRIDDQTVRRISGR